MKTSLDTVSTQYSRPMPPQQPAAAPAPAAAQAPVRLDNFVESPAAGTVQAKVELNPSLASPRSVRPLATETVSGSASPNAAIQDNSKVESTIRIDRDLDITQLSANLDIDHTYRGDLVVTLTSPSGKSAVISNREGGSADNIQGKFDLSAFAGESSKGEWKLTVEDKARLDVGTLKSWSLDITGTTEPKPVPDGQVDPQDIPTADWNMFVYLDADNNLEKYGKADMNEMEKVGSMEGKMNVFALVDGAKGYQAEGEGWKDSTRLMWIQKDPNDSSKIVSKEVYVDPESDLGKLMAAGKGELNLGDPQVMNAALRYVQEQIPSNNLMVDLWDHGDGWKLCSSDNSGDDLSPVAGELKKALEGVKVDVLGFDECLMSTKEVADIAQAAGVKYMIGSEHTEPGDGWNYGDLLGRYQKLFEGDEPVTAEQIAKAVASSYVAGGNENSNMNVTDLEKLPELSAKLDVLADAIAASGGFQNPAVKAALGKAHRADYDSDQMDIGHFAKLLAENAPEGELKDAAVALQQAVQDTCFNQTPAGGIAKDSTGLTVYTPRYGMASEYVSNKENPWVGSRWTALIQSQKTFRAPPAQAPRAQYPHPLRAPRANEWFL